MGVVADMLSSRIPNLSRPVVDKTGLTGEYTMQLEFRFQPPGPTGAAAPVDEFSESLFHGDAGAVGVETPVGEGRHERTCDRPSLAAN